MKFFLKYKIGQYPFIFLPGFKLKNFLNIRRRLIANKKTDIIIDGFPRSANTYAVLAFQYAQKKNLRIAHHIHVAAHILYGIKYNIPTIVLIRNPIDATLSLVVRHDCLNLNTALKCYILFYKPLLKHKNRIVIAEFNDVLKDYGQIINKVNQKYKTNFKLYKKTEESEKILQRKIRLLNKLDMNTEEGLSIPTAKKEEKKLALKKYFYSNRYILKLKDEALKIYEEMLHT